MSDNRKTARRLRLAAMLVEPIAEKLERELAALPLGATAGAVEAAANHIRRAAWGLRREANELGRWPESS